MCQNYESWLAVDERIAKNKRSFYRTAVYI